MMVVMVVMVGGNGWCFFGWRGSRSDAFKILKRGDSNSRRGRSFGCMVVMMVVTIKRLAQRWRPRTEGEKQKKTKKKKSREHNKTETYWW
jgi:hypothetical protein